MKSYFERRRFFVKEAILISIMILMFLIFEWQITGLQAHQKELNCQYAKTAYEYYYCRGR
jgi:hypothetical protein